MQSKHSIWLYLFFVITAINLSAEFLDSRWLIYASKPLLMIVLSIYLYLETNLSNRYLKYIFGGFIFSFFGDTFLMFVENDADKAHFFLLGLGSFLITHLCYFLAFWTYPNARQNGFVVQKKWIAVLFLFYLVGNSLFLLPDVPSDLQIAVVIYSTMIVSMAVACLNLKDILENSIFQVLFVGVLLFVISDSIIGLNKFKSHQIPIPYPRLLIMTFYLASQYLIAKASVKLAEAS